MTFRRRLVWAAALATAVPAAAEYTITPTNGGSSARSVGRGLSFDLDITLSSDAMDEHNSAIYRVVFSAPGLEYADYVWAEPYTTGTVYDDSFPFLDLLDPPLALDGETLSGPAYPEDVVDVELSNVVPEPDPPGPPVTFGEGLLTTLTIAIPASFPVDTTVTICVEPDTVANGFELVSTVAGPPFELTVVLAGDLDEDGDVDVDDLVGLVLAWGECAPPPAECPADLDGSGTIDVTDLVVLILNWS